MRSESNRRIATLDILYVYIYMCVCVCVCVCVCKKNMLPDMKSENKT